MAFSYVAHMKENYLEELTKLKEAVEIPQVRR